MISKSRAASPIHLSRGAAMPRGIFVLVAFPSHSIFLTAPYPKRSLLNIRDKPARLVYLVSVHEKTIQD